MVKGVNYVGRQLVYISYEPKLDYALDSLLSITSLVASNMPPLGIGSTTEAKHN